MKTIATIAATVLIWANVGLWLGLVGAKLGPGAIMFLAAVLSAGLGAIATIVMTVTRPSPSALRVAVVTFALGMLAIAVLAWRSLWAQMGGAGVVAVGLVHLLVSILGAWLVTLGTKEQR